VIVELGIRPRRNTILENNRKRNLHGHVTLRTTAPVDCQQACKCDLYCTRWINSSQGLRY